MPAPPNPPLSRLAVGFIALLCVSAMAGLFALNQHLNEHFRSEPPSERSRRLVCGSNLKGIGTSLRIYQAEHGLLPDAGFRTLVDSGAVALRQLNCPSSGKTVEDVEKDLHACYVLVAGNGSLWSELPSPSDTIVAYERDNHGGEGGHVLYADGRVEFVRPYAEVLRQVEESMQRLKEPDAKPQNP